MINLAYFYWLHLLILQFAEAFADIQGSLKPTISPKDEEIIEAAEGTCDEAWEGYVKLMFKGYQILHLAY